MIGYFIVFISENLSSVYITMRKERGSESKRETERMRETHTERSERRITKGIERERNIKNDEREQDRRRVRRTEIKRDRVRERERKRYRNRVTGVERERDGIIFSLSENICRKNRKEDGGKRPREMECEGKKEKKEL